MQLISFKMQLITIMIYIKHERFYYHYTGIKTIIALLILCVHKHIWVFVILIFQVYVYSDHIWQAYLPLSLVKQCTLGVKFGVTMPNTLQLTHQWFVTVTWYAGNTPSLGTLKSFSSEIGSHLLPGMNEFEYQSVHGFGEIQK